MRGVTPHLRSGVATRGVTPCLRSGAAVGRRYPTPQARGRGGGREDLLSAPTPRPRVAAGRRNPTPEARGSGLEDQFHVQGAVAVRAQEGLEELSHVEGQEGQR